MFLRLFFSTWPFSNLASFWCLCPVLPAGLFSCYVCSESQRHYYFYFVSGPFGIFWENIGVIWPLGEEKTARRKTEKGAQWAGAQAFNAEIPSWWLHPRQGMVPRALPRGTPELWGTNHLRSPQVGRPPKQKQAKAIVWWRLKKKMKTRKSRDIGL